MSPKYVMFLGLLLAAGTLISATFAGAWLTDTDLAVTNSLSVFKEANILGIWSVTVPNTDFLLTGAVALTSFDFGFFNGSLQLLQWFFVMVFGLGFLWGVYIIVINVLSGVFGKVRG